MSAENFLRAHLPEGGHVYSVVRSVSRSGMSRTVDVYVLVTHDGGKPTLVRISHFIAEFRGIKCAKNGALIVRGCGIDVVQHVVSSLSRDLHNRDDALTHQNI